MNATSNGGNVVGLKPWLPWPLNRWPWWTEPVRAERLAIMRIGLAAVLLLDQLISYWPNVRNYFGEGAMGTPEFFAWLANSPRFTWSIFRGLDHSLVAGVSLMTWAAATFILVLCSMADEHEPHKVRRFVWLIWLCAGAIYFLGYWKRVLASGDIYDLTWILPAANFGIVLLYAARHFFCSWRHRLSVFRHPFWPGILLAVYSLAMTGIGVWVYEYEQLPMFLEWMQWQWHQSADLLWGAMMVWSIATFCLMIGFFTRTSAIVVWMLSMSFANLNNYIDNAGDVIRGIILFYLMISPCGAAWSVDRLWRRRSQPGPVYIYPWALRLLFVQMVLIYFMNGVYKSIGDDWHYGVSLYYVLSDLTLSRFSHEQLPMPYWLTRIVSWIVLVWEISFPFAMIFRWTRRIALLIGVAFHLGIFLMMELGGFVPYMLVLYLPLLPWENLLRTRSRVSGQPNAST